MERAEEATGARRRTAVKIVACHTKELMIVSHGL